MDVSCHSFVRMARLAAPLMTEGGTLFAMTYHGSNKVIPSYSVMGPVKAALEAAVRYLAYELGPQGHPRACRLARPDQDAGVVRLEGLRSAAQRGRPAGARWANWWTSTTSAWPRLTWRPTYARRITGSTLYVDAGLNIMAIGPVPSASEIIERCGFAAVTVKEMSSMLPESTPHQ